jgi:hypothetical protein
MRIAVFFILTMIIVLYSAMFGSNSDQIGGSGFRFTKNIFPFDDPFDQSFYHPKRHIYKTYIGSDAELETLHGPLIKHTIGHDSKYQIVKTLSSGSSSSSISDLNDYKLDFIIEPELNIGPKYISEVHQNVRFVCALYSADLLLLTPNSINIIDLGDIRHWKKPTGCPCKVRIAISGDEHSAGYQILTHLLSFESDVVNNIEFVSSVTPGQLLAGYGSEYQIYADLASSKNTIIRTLTDRVPSHLVRSNKINGGNYFITDRERPFYRKYPYFRKKLLDILQLRRAYPSLSQVHNRDLYYPTIQVRYVLLTNDHVPDEKIKDVLERILKLMYTFWDPGSQPLSQSKSERFYISKLFQGTSVLDISYIATRIPTHDIAKQIYTQAQLHSVNSTSFYKAS